MTDLPILLLAAGGSSRMRGRDKLMEEVEGRPMVARQAALARAASSGAVIVALPPAPHPRHAALAGLDVTILPVAEAAEGMGATLRNAVAALPAGTAAAMVLLADLPDLPVPDLEMVAAAVTKHPEALIWRGATEDGHPGHPIVFTAQLFGDLMRLEGDSGGQSVVRQAGDRVHLVPLPGQRARRDLDTPEAWAAWRAER